MATHQGIQKRHETLWGAQPIARRRLTQGLEESGITLSIQDYVDIEEIAAHMAAWDQQMASATPPQVKAFRLGHSDWVRPITAVLKRLGTKAGGRPRHADDANLLLSLAEKCGGYRDWKTIAIEFEKQTGRQKAAEACRSAVRRQRARLS